MKTSNSYTPFCQWENQGKVKKGGWGKQKF